MLLGKQLGPYQILDEIGKGGMAAVYRARQTSIERDVAIKVILKGILGDPSNIQRFQREAKLIARLEHPHILPVYDFDGSHEPPYIVMRYLEGGTLKDVMAQGLLPLNEVAYVMTQVCAALDYAHRQGITHRDIKPSNIMIDREGNAFVADFGIARTQLEDKKNGITKTGAIIGTPDYMSPEQATGAEDVDYRTDIYALGIMLFEMLTGELPFKAESGLQVLMLHMNTPAPSVLTRNPALPSDIDLVIQQALAKDRDARYQNAVEMSAAITEALGEQAKSSSSHPRLSAGTRIIHHLERVQASTEIATNSPLQHKTVVALNVSATAYAELVADSRGAEAAQRALQAFWQRAEEIISEQGGVIFARADNERLALWGSNSRREDDDEQAIRAALKIQSTLQKLGTAYLADNEDLPLNIGIHRGLVLLNSGDKSTAASASGVTIGLANRLMQNAEGIILISHDVLRQVLGIFDIQNADPIKVRGQVQKLDTYQVERAKPRAFRVLLHGVEGIETRMIGREAEFKHLQKAFLLAVDDSETQVVSIVGDAGVGKSRLLYEFDKWGELRPEQYFLFSGRASPTMSEQSYALIRDMLSFRFEVMDDDAPAVILQKFEVGVSGLIGKDDETAHLLAYLCGVDVSQSPHLKSILGDAQESNRRARQAFIHLIKNTSEKEPVALELEDLHYADNASLDLLNDLVVTANNCHLLVLACTRPSLYEHRPTWGSGQSFHSRLDLKPLDKLDSRDLVQEILQKAGDIPKALRDLLVERAEGNPLYLEELVKMLLDDRIILKESETIWRIEAERLDSLSVPMTLAGLMEARFDTLLYPEKITLQRASVLGRIFYDSALHTIDSNDDTHLGNLSSILEKLIERDFIRLRETSAFADSKEYIFASAMLRDMIYERLLERQKQSYHYGAAQWLASFEHIDDYLPQIATHYEQAGELAQASHYLQRAGERLLKRGLFVDAMNLLQQALTYLPPDTSPTPKTTLLLGLGKAASWHGDLPFAERILSEACDLAAQLNDPQKLASSLYELSLVKTALGDYIKAKSDLDQALLLVRDGGNPNLLAEVLYGLANLHFRIGNLDEGIAVGEECLKLSKITGDEVLEMQALNRLGTLYNNASDSGLASGEKVDIETSKTYYLACLALAEKLGHEEGKSIALSNLSYHAMLIGDWQASKEYSEQALHIARNINSLVSISNITNNLSDIHFNLFIQSGLPATTENLKTVYRFAGENLEVSQKISSIPLALHCLDIIAKIKVLQGDINDGLRLTGLIKYHPASDNDLQIYHDQEFKLVYPAYDPNDPQTIALQEEGRQLDIYTVMEEALQEIRAILADTG